MRRDIGGHAHGNPARAIDQHVREPRRQDRRFLLFAIVIVDEIDRVLVDIGQKIGRRRRHAHLGIAHRRRVIPVHRPEIALTVQKRQRHREILRHAHQGFVDRAVAMGVVLAHHIAHGPRRFAVGLVMGIAGLMHGKEDAPMHRFQPVAQIGDRAGDDDAHRVVDERGLHLLAEMSIEGPWYSGAGFLLYFQGVRACRSTGTVALLGGLYLVVAYYTANPIWGAMGQGELPWQPAAQTANTLFSLIINLGPASFRQKAGEMVHEVSDDRQRNPERH